MQRHIYYIGTDEDEWSASCQTVSTRRESVTCTHSVSPGVSPIAPMNVVKILKNLLPSVAIEPSVLSPSPQSTLYWFSYQNKEIHWPVKIAPQHILSLRKIQETLSRGNSNKESHPTTHFISDKDTRNTFKGPLEQGKSSEREHILHSVSRRVFIKLFHII